MLLKPMSVGQTLGWYFSSFVYGLALVFIASTSGAFSGPSIAAPAAVFFLSWLAGVVLLRVYVQDKDPTSFRSLVGFKTKRD